MRDIVCNMDLDSSAKFKSGYKDNTYYFCCTGCKQQFDKSPMEYLNHHPCAGNCRCGKHVG